MTDPELPTPHRPAEEPPDPVVQPCPTPKLEIYDQIANEVVSDCQMHPKVVGQKMKLLVRGLPAGAAVTDVFWIVPPLKTLKSYKMEPEKTTKEDIARGDLFKQNLEFYWSAGGPTVISVVGTVNGVRECAIALFNVQSPSLDSFTSTTWPVQVIVVTNREEKDTPYLRCGANLDDSPGIVWWVKVTPPAGGDGEIEFVQTLQMRWERSGKSTQRITISEWWLDGEVPYGGVKTSPPYAVVATVQTPRVGNADTPGPSLDPGFVSYECTMSFTVYLMFKPRGDAIWVPLGKLDWGWNGMATSTDNGDTWAKKSGDHRVNNPTGVPTNEFPMWTGRKTDTYPPWK
jgi:hypothetical protein